MLERSNLTLDSIRTSILDLTSTNPVKALKVLALLNTTFSRAVAEAFIGFCAVHGVEAIEGVPDKLWKEAEIITSFDQRAITARLGRRSSGGSTERRSATPSLAA